MDTDVSIMGSLLVLSRWVHVVFGFLGLAAFWVPIVSRKGGSSHRRFGRLFRYSAIMVIGFAGITVSLHMTQLLLTGHGPSVNPAGWSSLIFLGYLALVTGVMLSHGIGVLQHKRDLRVMNTAYHRSMAWLAIVGSVVVLAWALYWNPPNAMLLYALSPLGAVNGAGMLRTYRHAHDDAKKWLYEHLRAMLGSGIAFHTAFAVFGVSQLLKFQLPGLLALIPWLLPTALGVPAIVLWTRYYRQHSVAPARR